MTRSISINRRLIAGLPALLAIVLIALVSAGPAAARTAPSGSFTVKPGQTLRLSNISLAPMNNLYFLAFGFTSDYTGDISLGDNTGTTTTVYPADQSVSNPADATDDMVVRVWLYSVYTNGSYPWAYYHSDGASWTSNYTENVDHATTGWVKGKATISINGVGSLGTLQESSTYQPTLGQGDLNATVTITKTPRQ